MRSQHSRSHFKHANKNRQIIADSRFRLSLLAASAIGAVCVPMSPAAAACVFVPGPGNDTFVCDSGTSAGGYSTNLGGEKQRLVEGNIGLTVTW